MCHFRKFITENSGIQPAPQTVRSVSEGHHYAASLADRAKHGARAYARKAVCRLKTPGDCQGGWIIPLTPLPDAVRRFGMVVFLAALFAVSRVGIETSCLAAFRFFPPKHSKKMLTFHSVNVNILWLIFNYKDLLQNKIYILEKLFAGCKSENRQFTFCIR